MIKLNSANFLSLFLSSTVITCFLAFSSANSQTQSTASRPLTVEIFVDRVVLEQDEPINVKVWVESESKSSVTVTIFYAKEQLKNKGEDSQQVSSNSSVTFNFTAQNVGKSNLAIEVRDKNNNTILPVRKEIQNIEVKSLDQWWSQPSFFTSLFGVILGTLLTLITTFLLSYFQKREEREKRKQWILGNLVAQLKENHSAILNLQKAKYTSWMSKLLTEGYDIEFQQLTKQQNKILLSNLFEIEQDLIDYEDDRSKNRLSNKKKYDLATKINQAITNIQNLGR